MRPLTIVAAATLLALLPGAARDQSVPEAAPAGEPVSCVPLRQIDRTAVHGDRVIDFHMRGGKVYRNELPFACPQLGFEERFLYKTSGVELCSVDTVTVLTGSSGIDRGATCGLGKFQPVTLAKKR